MHKCNNAKGINVNQANIAEYTLDYIVLILSNPIFINDLVLPAIPYKNILLLTYSFYSGD